MMRRHHVEDQESDDRSAARAGNQEVLRAGRKSKTLSAFSPPSPSEAVEDVLTEFGGKGFGVFKPALAETLRPSSVPSPPNAPSHR